VSLEIADRKVYQRGLVIPIGRLSQIEMDGWVSFDKDVNVTVRVPVLPTALANRPVVGGIAANSRIKIPIRGSSDKFEIDKTAFKAGSQELGTSVLEQGLGQGAMDLLRLFNRPRDPNAPPPPPRLTPEERRELRQERKAEKKARRMPQPP